MIVNLLTHPMGRVWATFAARRLPPRGTLAAPALPCRGVGAANNTGRGGRQGTVLLESSVRRTAEVGKAHDAILQYR